ncbi:MAG: DUF262 domain-containing protein, partial [Terriglobales bacterium]
MGYESLTIRQAIRGINHRFFLPSLQREFVWKQNQIIRLFDSIMREYPISSFLFWRPDSSTTKGWASYKFLEEIKDGGSHNAAANLGGVNRPVFVLDGQQRLTALNIGLRGIYRAKEKYKWRNNPDAYRPTRLFIDLIRKNVGTEEEGGEARTYFQFSFIEKPPLPTKKSCWFEVGKILKCPTKNKLDIQIRAALGSLPGSASQIARESVKQTLRDLQKSIFLTPT